MAVTLAARPRREGLAPWRHSAGQGWALGAAALTIASVLVPLLAGAAPIVILVGGFLVTARGLPLAFTLVLTSLTYLLGIGGVSLIILPIKILGGVDSFVLAGDPAVHPRRRADGIEWHLAADRRFRDGDCRPRPRRPGDGGGVAEILFSGISGSTAADVSAISSLLIPSMRKAGYSGPESVSVVAAASAMGILVPPCLTMVVLGSLVNISIVTLFLAGFVPAFVLAAALIALRARRQHWPVTAPPPRRQLPRILARAAAPLGLPVIPLGGHLFRRHHRHRSGAPRRGLCLRGWRRRRWPAPQRRATAAHRAGW